MAKAKKKTQRYVPSYTGSAVGSDGVRYEFTRGTAFEAPAGVLDNATGLTGGTTDADIDAAIEAERKATGERLTADPVAYRGQALTTRRGVIDAGVAEVGGTLDGPPVHVGPGGSAANADPSNVKTPAESVEGAPE